MTGSAAQPRGGIFSATEASAIAVAYAFLVGVVIYREVRLKDIPGLLLQAGKTTSIVMLLVGTSQAMSWIMAYENIPQTVSSALLALSENTPFYRKVQRGVVSTPGDEESEEGGGQDAGVAHGCSFSAATGPARIRFARSRASCTPGCGGGSRSGSLRFANAGPGAHPRSSSFWTCHCSCRRAGMTSAIGWSSWIVKSL